MAQAGSIFEVAVSDIQGADLAISGNAVIGTSKWLAGPNAITAEWGAGNFLALAFTAADWTVYDSVLVGLTDSQGSGLVEIKDDTDHTATVKVTDKDAQQLIIKAFKGGISQTWLYSLSGLTLAPET
jgi:hypothetical protein